LRKPLEYYLGLEYPLNAVADESGGYVVVFPDLSGCITQIDSLAELPEMADEARRLWIETAYDHGADIPEPSYPEEYSGRFNLRIPRSLHRQLAESAEEQGVSLNQYVLMLLARADALDRVERKIDGLAPTRATERTYAPLSGVREEAD
jgi:predicted RNase H-like HicB family nuclease